jgi:RNA polymerase sigma-70 factor (ECF subfamily)
MHLRSPWQRARSTLDMATPDAVHGLEWQAVELPLAERIDLERALARLPDLARAIVWMHDVEGLSHEEIAGLFGRSVSFSKSRLSRAHAQLRAQLAGHRVSEPAIPATDIAASRTLP